mgnify:CR=1 FL=1
MAYETNAVGLDLSHYDEVVKADLLKGNVDFLTVKCGGSESGLYADARFAERVQMAFDIGALCGAYWFAGPGYWLGKQQTMAGIDNMTDDQHPILQFIMQTLKNKLIYWLAFDVEDASLWTTSGQVTEVWVKYYVADLVERIQRQQAKGNMRPFKLGVYSRRSFIDDPAKPQTSLNNYLGVHPDLFLWTANWVNGTGATLPMSDVHKLRPSAAHIPYSFGYSAARPQTWQFFQWSGDAGRVYRSPAVTNAAGAARGLDLDLFNGTPEQLKTWAGIGVTPPPVDPEPPLPPADTAQLDRIEAAGKAAAEAMTKFGAAVKGIQEKLEQHFK